MLAGAATPTPVPVPSKPTAPRAELANWQPRMGLRLPAPVEVGSAIAGLAAAALWVIAVMAANPSRMGQLGLITVLPWTYFAGLAVLATALTWELARVRPVVMCFLAALLVVYLFGTASAIEPVARLSVSWLHAGLTEQIAVTGRPLPPVDARASWPGGFSLAAFIMRIASVQHSSDLLRWAPVAFQLLYLPPLRVIARAVGVSERAGWLGTLLWYATNGIEQEYFSPQALNLLFYLVVLAAVLSSWETSVVAPQGQGGRGALPADPMGVLPRWWQRRYGGRGRLGPARQSFLLVLLILLFCAIVASHQLTPYALFLALSACFLARRLPGPELPLILAALAVGQLSVGAAAFWSGHMNLLFGSIGQVQSSVNASVGDRIRGAPQHEFIVYARILLTVVLILIAACGALRRRRRQERALELLAAAPFVLIVLQSYGGEGLLRVALFSLPFTSLLAGVAIAPLVERASDSFLRRAAGTTALAVTLAEFALLLTLVRGGNDPYVSFASADRAAVLQVYARIRPGQSLASYVPYIPAEDRGLNEYRFLSADGGEDLPRDLATTQLLDARPDYLILTDSQRRWGELVRGWPADWLAEVRRRFLDAGYHQLPAAPSVTLLQAPPAS